MRRQSMVVGCPFVEVIGNVVSGWIGCGIFEIDDDDLGEFEIGISEMKIKGKKEVRVNRRVQKE